MGWSGNIEAAGKTGTTNGSRDGWFCGMTPYYTMTVWVGYDQQKTFPACTRHVSGEDLEKCDGKDGRGASGGVL